MSVIDQSHKDKIATQEDWAVGSPLLLVHVTRIRGREVENSNGGWGGRNYQESSRHVLGRVVIETSQKLLSKAKEILHEKHLVPVGGEPAKGEAKAQSHTAWGFST